MREHFNQLTPAQAERLAILSEECGEVIQAVSKILRHGYGSWTNLQDLERELGDVMAASCLLSDADDIDPNHVMASAKQKLKSVIKYTHHQ